VIDTHCHLLPGVDDGPSDTSHATALARALVADGVETVLCTPHFSRRYTVEPAVAAELLASLAGTLAEFELPLRLVLAAETSPTFAAIKPAEELRPRAIAGRFLLVELEPGTTATALDTLLANVEAAGLTPVLAHPERCHAVQSEPDLLERLAPDAVVQLVAPSLLGPPGSRTARAAWDLLERGDADLLASDAHGARERAPRLQAAAALVASRYGAAAADALTRTTPARLLAGDLGARRGGRVADV
jgi:protein-tyrosine phosphatase